MAHILITEFMDTAAVERLGAHHQVHHDPELVDKPAELLERARDADALIVRNRTQVRGDLLSALIRCRVVGRLGVGLDNIDVAGCEARGMEVMAAIGANAQSVAEYVIGTAMLLLRGAYRSTEAVAAGHWPRSALSSGREIHGTRLGLIGFGSIGQATARLAHRLGISVMAHDPFLPDGHPAYSTHQVVSVGLDQLLQQADVISLHVPLLDSTRHLINPQRLALMRPEAILINTARGGVVDEAALITALHEGRLAGAALDVFEQEPLPAGTRLVDVPGLLLTPHIAGVSRESNVRVSEMIATGILSALGTPSL